MRSLIFAVCLTKLCSQLSEEVLLRMSEKDESSSWTTGLAPHQLRYDLFVASTNWGESHIIWLNVEGNWTISKLNNYLHNFYENSCYLHIVVTYGNGRNIAVPYFKVQFLWVQFVLFTISKIHMSKMWHLWCIWINMQ